MSIGKWRVRIEFKLQDLWIGAFWKSTWGEPYRDRRYFKESFDLWICLIPCLPIHFNWGRTG